MNLQRREEIRELINILDSFESSAATECKVAMREMLSHIDSLEQTAAERVIADGHLESAQALVQRLSETIDRMAQGIKPSSADRCAARWAVSSAKDRASFERGWEAREAEGMEPTMGAGPTPDYTGEESAWVPPKDEKMAVVLPELDADSIHPLIQWAPGFRVKMGETAQAINEWLRENARAIHADRELGEGERKVDSRRFDRMLTEESERPYLLELERYVRTMARLQNWQKDALDYGPLKRLDAIRANQGGTAT